MEFSEALEIARDMIKRFTEDEEIDKAFLIYNEFKSVLQQRVVLEQLLPVARAKAEEPDAKPASAVNAHRLHLRATARGNVWPTAAAY